MWRVLFQLVRADFRERSRRSSYFVTLCVTAYLGHVALPAVDASYAVINLGGYRGVYNSATVGVTVAMFTTIVLTLAGFYLTSNTVDHDRRTGVGEILATTPISKPLYTFGKFLGNLLLLMTCLLIMTAAAGVMQLVRAEVVTVEPWKLIAPFLFFTVPAAAVVAALAVLFETVPCLRSTAGNTVYLIVWIALLSLPVAGFSAGKLAATLMDMTGIGIILRAMGAAVTQVDPTYQGDHTGIGLVVGATRTFAWDGLVWTASLLWSRLAWIGAAIVMAVLAALPFDRFDTARLRGDAGGPGLAREPVSTGGPGVPYPAPGLTGDVERRLSRWLMVRAELRLMLFRQGRWWYWGALGLMLAGLLAPPAFGRRYLLPVAWMWPVALWSAMGAREVRYRTEALVLSAPSPISHHLLATWVAGVLLSLAVGGGVGLRIGVSLDGPGLLGWLVGALFIPTLALTMGLWSGSSRLFEVVYSLMWYVGPVNGVPGLDFMGALAHDGHLAVLAGYSLATVGLLGLAVVARHRQAGGDCAQQAE